jgi:hypothetical protein
MSHKQEAHEALHTHILRKKAVGKVQEPYYFYLQMMSIYV